MGAFRSFAGLIQISLTSADISRLLSLLAKRNITLFQVQIVDELTAHATIYRKDYIKILIIARKRQDKIKIIHKKGIYWSMKVLLSRPILIAGLAIFLFLSLYLPDRILFVKVEGNTQISTQQILDSVSENGISFLSSRRAIRSEKVKNALIEKHPLLQWVGVNTAGCVATISVKEKTTANLEDDKVGISSIVASRDGVIVQSEVIRGNPLCQVGQAVKAGQVLVSGYTTCGKTIIATRAEAEIYAQTLQDISLVSPTKCQNRTLKTHTKTKYSLIIGKNLIKLFKGSGISDTSCVKMYERYYLTLPGGFQLPIAIVSERYVYYESQEIVQEENAFEWVYNTAEDYLLSQMVAGQILNKKVTIEASDEMLRLQGYYACIEMIAQEKTEEILQR